MQKRIVVTGPNGFVGSYIMKALPDAVPAAKLRGDEAQVAACVRDADIIIHTAAIADMGVCEKDPEASYRANVLLPLWIAKAAPQAKLIFYSTDQVYNGSPANGPFTEAHTHPINVYARHKLEMEQRVLDLRPDAVMRRATWMYDWEHGFIGNIRRSEGTIRAADQYRGLTWIEEVARLTPLTFDLPGGSYNWGSPAEHCMRTVTEETLGMLGRTHQVLAGEKRHPLWMNVDKATRFGIVFP